MNERPAVRILAPADLWLHGAAALGAPLAFLSGLVLQDPSLADRLGLEVERVAFVHASGAGLLILAGALHLARLCLDWLAGRSVGGLLPRRADLGEFRRAVAFGLGLRRERPMWGRFSYREKVPYLTFLAALPVMAATGFAISRPALAVGVVGPDRLVALASVHLAVGALLSPLLLWHVFFSHFQPGALFWNGAWLTGRVSWDRLERTRPGWATTLTQGAARTEPEAAVEAESVEHFLTEGNRAAREGRYGDAEHAYLEALSRYPGYSQALFNLGVARWRGGNPEGSREALARFLEQDPFSPVAAKARQILDEIEANDGTR